MTNAHPEVLFYTVLSLSLSYEKERPLQPYFLLNIDFGSSMECDTDAVFVGDYDLLAAAEHLLLHEAPQVVPHQEQEDCLHTQVYLYLLNNLRSRSRIKKVPVVIF
jgi:hypothetical protein